MIMSIIQGSQYFIPIKFKNGNDYFTPDNVTDIKVQLGDKRVTYLGGGLAWDEVNSYWKYWLSQEQSLALKYGGSALKMQAEIKIGNNIFCTELMSSAVGKNIIEEVFGND